MDFIEILNLPKRCLIQSRISKKVINDSGSLNTSEKKLLKDVVHDMYWLAAVKPQNSNIPEVRNESYIYDEVHFIQVAISDINKYKKVAEMLQRSIPYPLVLLMVFGEQVCISTADKRINQKLNSKRIINGYTYSGWYDLDSKNAVVLSFFNSLNYVNIRHKDLKSFYENFTARIISSQVAEISGNFEIKSVKQLTLDIEKLKRQRYIKDEIEKLKKELKKAIQISDKVELNISIKRFQSEMNEIKELLCKI